MRITITTAGLLDQRRLISWLPEKQRAIREAVRAGMHVSGREMADAARSEMLTAFRVRKKKFVKSMRHRVYSGHPVKLPMLIVGSRIRWLGIHARGGTIRGRMLIPLLPEHQRIGRKAFRRVIDGLMRTGNAFFIEKNGKVILMAESIKENEAELRRFKRAERMRTGLKSIKRGTEIPIAVLVPAVKLRMRYHPAGAVRAKLPKLVSEISKRLDAIGF